MAESKEQEKVVDLKEKEISQSEAEGVKGGMGGGEPAPKIILRPADPRLIIPCI